MDTDKVLCFQWFILASYLKQHLFLDGLINSQIISSAKFSVGDFNFPDLEMSLLFHNLFKKWKQESGLKANYPQAQ